jgi:alpha-tubulin suppressor-like RCC1 family protein
VVCWGDNAFGQLASPRPASSDVPVPIQGIFGAAQIVAAGDGTCVRHTDKTVRCWGRNDDGRLSPGHGETLNVPAPVHF